MNKILIVEILGISGSGKSHYYNLIKNYFEIKEINNKKLLKIQKLINLLGIFIIEIITLPRNIFLLISIFNYFIDHEHKKDLFSLIKRFLKIYKVYLSSKKNNILINQVTIKESIVHLSINLYKKDPKIFLEKIKKLYRTKNIIFLYLDTDINISLKRMHLRGDNPDNQINSREKRYKAAKIFHNSLLKETNFTNKSNKVISNLYLTSASTSKKNFKYIISWLRSLYL